ncbi:bifunctional uridylyltransferase/uridylyl-removing protein GlnD [Moritella viscosa]|uniref:Bifunctional uridylyltransferase/uridylyl-removing enzyme n=1 Tax=Moritella viscosa TaxID=80854 RepID=A0ABY1HDP6_9GAMM|nr:bifunctional uridylyltransferase/uridylyl-removing protein GlnD [Moritella viscosa]SGY90622.1 PII uridylyl-transferase [Moritella viscosa]SGY99993.1 PII uridylyl-transferase [Moritella viscosa]SHO26069.1 PII uridylyl-transferase [Moritella viscosa]
MDPTQYVPALLLDEELTLNHCKSHMQEFQAWLEQRFFDGDDIIALVSCRAEYMDQLLNRLWQKFGLAKHSELALVAVGGYGRGELHPKSDIDLLITTTLPLTTEQEQAISIFITMLWDLRLEVGHSVRTVDGCLEQGLSDITIATNLLESRLITGSEDTYAQLQDIIDPEFFWPSQDFFQAKHEEQLARHHQFKGSSYNLEPDLKSSPGGLRDLQTILWITRRHFGSNSFLELTNHGFLTKGEYHELEDCQNFLWRVRFALHLGLKRCDNRLLFDRQTTVAEALGYRGEGNQAVETMMKQFYQTIRRVTELNEMLLQLFNQAILGHVGMDVRNITADFRLRGSLIDTTSTDLFTRRPSAIIELFYHIADNEQITGIYAGSIRELRDARRKLTTWLEDIPECREQLMQLFKHPNACGLAITLMHKHGVIAAYIPQWSRILGQMQFDLFHNYTVDEHTHRLVKIINSYKWDKTKETHPLCCEIYPRLEKPELLIIAAIFHDIGKGQKGNHSEIGAIDARAFCKKHGINKADRKMVSRLVKYHLLMSVTAQRRDIHDPEIITEFARTIGDQEHLNYLYCLTVADICATNDSLWNNWKGSLLRELYFLTQQALRRGLENPLDAKFRIRNNKDTALAFLENSRFSTEQIQALWTTFRSEYFLRNDPNQICWHTTGILNHEDPTQPLVLISQNSTRGGNEVFIYAKDNKHLFASAVSTLGNKNLNIHDAKITSSRNGYVLDSFVILDQTGDTLAPDRVYALQAALETVLKTGNAPVLRKQRIPRQIKQFSVKTKVTFLATKKKRTFVEIITLDTPGLLARISAILSSENIVLHNAKISTIGERAEDFFIISGNNNQPLSPEQQAELRHNLITELADN